MSDIKAEQLKKNYPQTVMVDAFSRQIKELFFIDNPAYVGENKEAIYEDEVFKKYAAKKKNAYTKPAQGYFSTSEKFGGAH